MAHENYSTRQACEASGAGPTAVKRWKKQYQAELAGTPPPAGQALTPEQRKIQQLKKAHPVSQLCDALGVSRSGYYYWQAHRQPTAQRVHLQTQVKAIHAEANQTYGSPACRRR